MWEMDEKQNVYFEWPNVNMLPRLTRAFIFDKKLPPKPSGEFCTGRPTLKNNNKKQHIVKPDPLPTATRGKGLVD